jgi:phage terminase small subunit
VKDDHHIQRGQDLTGRETRPTTLTAKQARFIEEYLIDMNGAAAARRAGYSKKASAEAGYQLLTNTHVQAAIAAGRAKLSEACNIQALDIVKEVARQAFANIADYLSMTSDGDPYIDLSRCTRGQLSALQGLSTQHFKEGRGDDQRLLKQVRIRIADKTKNLALLAELLGFGANKRVEHSGSGKIENAKNDADAEAIRLMDTEDLRQFHEHAKAQEVLLAKTRPAKN